MTKVVWIKRSIEDVGSEAPVIWSARNQRHVKGEAEERKKKRQEVRPQVTYAGEPPS